MTYFLGKNKIFYAVIAALFFIGVISSLNRPISVAESDISKDQSIIIKDSAAHSIPADQEESKSVEPYIDQTDLPSDNTEKDSVIESTTNNQNGNSAIVIPTSLISPSPQTDLYKVTKVVDGDTIAVDIDGNSETLRLIGINTPETVDPRKSVECFGKEASDKAKAVLTGQSVRLEADSTQDERDKYGRLLRYVFLADGSSFNKMMISEGYAYEYTYNTPYKYQSKYKQAEKEAKEAQKGLWAAGICDLPINTTVVAPVVSSVPKSTSVSGKYDCSGNLYNCTDFSTHAEAQAAYDVCGGPATDIHRLDSDKDGLACESLP